MVSAANDTNAYEVVEAKTGNPIGNYQILKVT